MNGYLMQKIAAERGESMRAAAAAARLSRQARQASQDRPHDGARLLRAIPRQREPEESAARRAA